MKHLGVVGVGLMGRRMAARLLAAEFEVLCYDIDTEALTFIANEGGIIARGWDDFSSVEAVIVSVVSDAALADVFHRLLEVLNPGALVLDTGTSSPETERRLSEEGQRRQIHLLDCPVSGGIVGAEGGTLTIMVGGERMAFEQAEPILTTLGRDIFYVGPSGSGQAAKLCNNILCAINTAAVAEIFSLLDAFGVPREIFVHILEGSSGNSAAFERFIKPVLDQQSFTPPQFAFKHMLKDVTLYREMLGRGTSFAWLGTMTEQIYRAAAKHVDGNEDFTAILRAWWEWQQTVAPLFPAEAEEPV